MNKSAPDARRPDSSAEDAAAEGPVPETSESGAPPADAIPAGEASPSGDVSPATATDMDAADIHAALASLPADSLAALDAALDHLTSTADLFDVPAIDYGDFPNE